MFVLFLGYFVSTLCHVFLTRAAFTVPTSPNSYVGVIEHHDDVTIWCFDPFVQSTFSCTPNFNLVLSKHLNQSNSVGYYYFDGRRAGGAEWPVPTNPGLIFLCASGRAGDGTYLTFCAEPVIANDTIPPVGCVTAVAQSGVTDGCYAPGGSPYPNGTSQSDLPSSSTTGRGHTTTPTTVFTTVSNGHTATITWTGNTSTSHPRWPYPHLIATATLLATSLMLLLSSCS